MNITGNTIVITGGTSGIGRGLAEAFHDRGNRVIITGRRQALLDEITTRRAGMVGLRLDLDEPASLPQLAAGVRDRFPDLNVLIANAGVSHVEDMAADEWDVTAARSIIETNILGVLRVTAAFLPLLKRRRDSVVMATSSNLAFLPRSDLPTYCASKAFLHSWLQSLRHQLRKIPVEVLELAPPYVQTELTGKHQVADPRAMPLGDYIADVLRVLETRAHPGGEVLVERDKGRRTAEREGRYDAVYAAVNPQ